MKRDPDVLEQTLTKWVTTLLAKKLAGEGLEAISPDGKTFYGTLRSFARAVHLLAAVAHQTGSALSQCRVDEKTNDHKAALELLHGLVLGGRVIVGDAMFCHRDLCRQAVDSSGDRSTTFRARSPQDSRP